MKRSKAIGCPPLPEQPRGPEQRGHAAWLALLALTLVAPTISGCPGHLDELPSIVADGAAPQVPVGPIVSGPPAKMDAAPAPAIDAAAPPSMPPPAPVGPVPPVVDKATCAQATEIAGKIFTPKCAICHSGATAPAGLDLGSPGVKARLVNIASKSPKSGCAGQVLATADGSAGVIFNKLVGVGCGTQMPAMGPTLSNQEYWCIKEWLSPGAGGPYPAVAAYIPVVMQPTMGTAPPPAGGGGKADGGAGKADGGARKADGGVAAALPGGGFQASCASPQEISDKILKPKCLPCHGGPTPAQGVDLESPGARARLRGAPAKSCAGQIVARPDGTGLLLDLITNQVPPGCGGPMPFGGAAPLTAQEIACVQTWLAM